MINFIFDHLEEFFLVMGALSTFVIVGALVANGWDYIKEKWKEI